MLVFICVAEKNCQNCRSNCFLETDWDPWKHNVLLIVIGENFLLFHLTPERKACVVEAEVTFLHTSMRPTQLQRIVASREGISLERSKRIQVARDVLMSSQKRLVTFREREQDLVLTYTAEHPLSSSSDQRSVSV